MYEDPQTTLNPQQYTAFIPRAEDPTVEREYGLSQFTQKQIISVQDCPEHVPQGRIPRSV